MSKREYIDYKITIYTDILKGKESAEILDKLLDIMAFHDVCVITERKVIREDI